jgi:hypothetical protein
MAGSVLAVELPGALEFLNWGWWILHVVGIVVVGWIGYTIGRKKSASPAAGQGQQQQQTPQM